MNPTEIHDLQRATERLSGLGNTEIIETHISWVILTPGLAYKIKKPVKFTFLDFSTIEKRKHYCERELALNRRLARRMYKAVVPVFKSPAGISFNGSGEIIDYAVVMKRMDGSLEMDRLLMAGKVSLPAITRLASRIANFHRDAAVITGDYSIENIRNAFNDIEEAPLTSAHDREVIKNAITFSDHFLREHGPLLAERFVRGFVRDVHGDLHTGNIFLYPEPVVFDCIEFNDSLRRIDILDEVAFLCMDIEAFGRADLAESFYRKYIEFSDLEQTASSRAVFSYFKLYRANIRAKVMLLKMGADPGTKARADSTAAAQRYVNLMLAYMLTNQDRT